MVGTGRPRRSAVIADDDLRAKVAAALRQALARAVEPEVIRNATEAVLPLLGDGAPAQQESAAERHRRENAEALEIMGGKGRGAASVAARKLGRGDPQRTEALRRRFNRLRKKLGHFPECPKIERGTR